MRNRAHRFAALHMSPYGTNLPIDDVRATVAIGGEADARFHWMETTRMTRSVGSPPSIDALRKGSFALDVGCLGQSGIHRTRFMEYPAEFLELLQLDIGCPDYLGPFLDVFGDGLAEVGWRDRKWHAAELDKPRPQPGVGEAPPMMLMTRVRFAGEHVHRIVA